MLNLRPRAIVGLKCGGEENRPKVDRSNQNEAEINKLKNEISEIKSLQEKILKKLEKE